MKLKETVAPNDRAFARIAAAVAGFALEIDAGLILRPERGAHDVAFARQVAMYLCHVAFEFSVSRVARAFARDPSTAAHACHIIEDKRDDEVFDHWIGALEMALRDTPMAERTAEARR